MLENRPKDALVLLVKLLFTAHTVYTARTAHPYISHTLTPWDIAALMNMMLFFSVLYCICIYIVFIKDLKKCNLFTNSLSNSLNAKDTSTSKNIYLSNPHFVVFQSGWHVESWGDTSEIDCGNVGFGKSQVFTEWANTLKWRFEGAYPLVGEQLSSVILWCHSSLPFSG